MEIGSVNNKGINSYIDKAAQSSGEITGESFEARLKSAMDKKDDKELKNVCQQFESIMLGMVYKQMKATIPKSDFLKDDSSVEIFQSMLDDELVETASKRGSLGLADTMYKQLSRQLGTTQKTAASTSTDTAGAAGVKATDVKAEEKTKE